MVSGSRGGLGASQRLLSASSFQTRCRPGPDEETVATAIPSPSRPLLPSWHPHILCQSFCKAFFNLTIVPRLKQALSHFRPHRALKHNKEVPGLCGLGPILHISNLPFPTWHTEMAQHTGKMKENDYMKHLAKQPAAHRASDDANSPLCPFNR